MVILIVISCAIIAIAVVWTLKPKGKYVKGIELQKKFELMGSMKGMTKAEIIGKVGQPYTSMMVSGQELLQWIEVGFHIAIFFDKEGRFLEITTMNIKRDSKEHSQF